MAQPTMDDVAEAAGVSRALVSLVMRGRPNVSPDRRRRVLEAAAQLGYRPNAMARSLASRRTHTIGVLLNELHNPFYAEIMDGIEEVADEQAYRVLIGTGGRGGGGEQRTIEAFLELRTDGIVLVGPRLASSRIAAAAKAVPVVVVARPMRTAGVDTIVNDERTGAELVVQHLAAIGHRRILHIDGGEGAGAAARRSGYERAMRAHGLGDEIRVIDGDYTEAAGVQAASAVLAAGDLPTAVFAANDVVAVGAIDRFEEAGLVVPADLSVVGYDNTFLAALHHVSLTTVNQPRADMGRLATRMLIDRIRHGGAGHGATRTLAAPTLVVRSTTAPPRQQRVAPSPS